MGGRETVWKISASFCSVGTPEYSDPTPLLRTKAIFCNSRVEVHICLKFKP